MPRDFPRRQPKPRPRGEFGFSSGYPSNRPFERRPQPQRPVSRRPRGPAIIEPTEPTSGKDRRRMLKAVVWRLSRLVHAKPQTLLTATEVILRDLLERAFPPPGPRAPRISGRGDAARLAAKLLRLRKI